MLHTLQRGDIEGTTPLTLASGLLNLDAGFSQS